MDAHLPAAQNHARPPVSEEAAESMRRAVFLIEADSARGTGWLIDENTIVTDFHVIKGRRNISAVAPDGRRYKLGAQVAFDNRNDLAILTFASAKPKDVTPLPLCKQEPQPGSAVFSYSHADGKAAQWFSGSQLGTESLQELLVRLSKNYPKNAPKYQNHLATETQETLNLPLSVSILPVRKGCSGGPIFNEQGEVVAVVRLGFVEDKRKLEYATPATKVSELHNGRDDANRFDLREGRREMNLLTHMQRASGDPVMFTIDSAGVGIGVVGGFRMVGRTTDPMCLISKSGAIQSGLAATAILGVRTYLDGKELINSTDYLDRYKYGPSLAADTTMAAGLGTSAAGLLRNGAGGRLGKGLFLAGLAARGACELIPNNYVVDIGEKKIFP